ncbi:unnamed protein product [Boreogadus saida]
MRHGISWIRRYRQTQADILSVAGYRSLKEVSRANWGSQPSGRRQVRKQLAVISTRQCGGAVQVMLTVMQVSPSG